MRRMGTEAPSAVQLKALSHVMREKRPNRTRRAEGSERTGGGGGGREVGGTDGGRIRRRDAIVRVTDPSSMAQLISTTITESISCLLESTELHYNRRGVTFFVLLHDLSEVEANTR